MSTTAKNLVGVSVEELSRALKRLHKRRKLILKRSKISNSGAVKSTVEDLESRLEILRSKYHTINIMTHPNAVIATLSNFQGQETQIQSQIKGWREIGNLQKDVDLEIKIHDSALNERHKIDKLKQ